MLVLNRLNFCFKHSVLREFQVFCLSLLSFSCIRFQSRTFSHALSCVKFNKTIASVCCRKKKLIFKLTCTSTLDTILFNSCQITCSIRSLKVSFFFVKEFIPFKNVSVTVNYKKPFNVLVNKTNNRSNGKKKYSDRS